MPIPPQPSLMGQRRPLLPHEALDLDDTNIANVYRQLGTQYGERLFARIMDGDEPDSPLMEVTWGQLLRDALSTANSMALQIHKAASITIGILAASSYHYFVHIVAAWLNHWTIILLSERNSLDGLESLLNAVNATALVTDSMHSKVANQIQRRLKNFRVITMQCSEGSEGLLVDALDHRRESSEDGIAHKTVLAYTHTSGTQGHPKPVPITNDYLISDIKTRAVQKYAGLPVYAPLPLYHGMGFYVFTRWPIGSGVVPTFVQMKQPLNGAALLRHIGKLPDAICFLPPVILEDIARNHKVDAGVLVSCKRIFFGGAPIDRLVAEKLIGLGAPLVSAFGSSELSVISELDFPSDNLLQDWEYIRPVSNRYIFHFLPIDASAVRHLVVSPGPGGSPAILNNHNPPGFASNDLWLPHPNLPGLWKHVGRKDAVTVLSTGEKTDNRQLESVLLQNLHISSVIVFGGGKPFNGVLLVPREEVKVGQASTFIDNIWDTIEEANRLLPSHSRLIKEMILVADPRKPITKTDKGTIRVADTLALYSDEIEAAYTELESTRAIVPKQANSTLRDQIREAVYRVAQRDIRDDEDVFLAGLDSFHAIQLRFKLVSILAQQDIQVSKIPHNLVYTYPTISQLIAYATDLQTGVVISQSSKLKEKKTRILNTIRNLQAQISEPRFPQASRVPDSDQQPYIIVLTGGTGSLGSHLLAELLQSNRVGRIYCLHRDSHAARHQRQFRLWGLPEHALQTSKLQCLSSSLAHPTLGLELDALKEIRSTVTHFIHAAWELNFNWKLDRFLDTHITGTKNLINLATSSTSHSPPRFVFISSIGAVANLCNRQSLEVVPEKSFSDPLICNDHGYAEGKFVAERLIDYATGKGLQATIIRSGQLSGSTSSGHWSATEFAPTLFRSSCVLNALPDELPDMRWLPVDVAARCVLDLSFQMEGEPLKYYHLENPIATPWKEIAESFVNAKGCPMSIIPTADWLQMVEQHSESSDKELPLPAVALLPFYHDFCDTEKRNAWVHLDTGSSQQISPALNFGTITPTLMQKYVNRAMAMVREKATFDVPAPQPQPFRAVQTAALWSLISNLRSQLGTIKRVYH